MRYEAVFATGWSETEDSSYDLILYTTVKVKEEVGERTWRNAARGRDGWQKLRKKALAQKGLLCRRW